MTQKEFDADTAKCTVCAVTYMVLHDSDIIEFFKWFLVTKPTKRNSFLDMSMST